MNRELKFRAWNGSYMLNAEYGDWISFDGVPYTQASLTYDTPNIEVEKAKNYILMQYTGLKDKNGKEIYEWDIVEYGITQKRQYRVYFDQGMFRTKVNALAIGNTECEVIGNIYENPELIKS